MKIKYFLQLITLFLALMFYTPTTIANVSSQAASAWGQNKGDEILQILTSSDSSEKYEKLDNILHNDADLPYAAKFVIGKYWRTMSGEQQKKYVDLFSRYMENLYKSYSLDIQKGTISFQVDKVITGTKNTDVHCTIFFNKLQNSDESETPQGIPVIFVIHETDGYIKVRDIKFGETSFLIYYRQYFQQQIHEEYDDEISWFLEDLETRVSSASDE
ncbi:MAG: ABC transporter substrate-binding protein [Alphaproteobacteria bacterium]|nr:ABC transporter substrate-binding protein [Alphaproteobacteria bacterium]